MVILKNMPTQLTRSVLRTLANILAKFSQRYLAYNNVLTALKVL